jgi:hypothetical protein
MKKFIILKEIIFNLTVCFIIQQLLTQFIWDVWYDLSTMTLTQTVLEILVSLYIVLSTVVEQTEVAVEPMKSPKPKDTTGPGDNIYFPNNK